jgi:hypothetical protein
METLCEALEEIAAGSQSTESAAKARALWRVIMSFDLQLGIEMRKPIFTKPDELSRSLQWKQLDVRAAEIVADVGLIKRLRTESEFDQMWTNVESRCSNLDTELAKLPRQRCLPKKLADGWTPRVFTTVKQYFRAKYCKILHDMWQTYCRTVSKISAASSQVLPRSWTSVIIACS